jgi:hypothetical protein
MDTQALLRHADAALHRAKNCGRNCFQVFAAGQDEGFSERKRKRNAKEATATKA